MAFTMSRTINVHLLPELISPGQLDGAAAVVIDLLRASTTIATALAAGAQCVIPCLDVEEARRVAVSIGPSALLGGERGGLRIDGFDLGNSPAEYTRESVGGRTIVFTTTNGTRALAACAGAERVLVGALVNLSAVCRVLAECPRVELVCAGTRGEMTREDALAAGAFVARLQQMRGAEVATLNDQAQLVVSDWLRTVAGDAGVAGQRALIEALRQSRGGHNLAAIHQDGDIALAATIDSLDVVPRFDAESSRITAL
jgi:2-phosphosulfolactate phosphatase